MGNKVEKSKDTEAKLTDFTQVEKKLILCVFEYLHTPFLTSEMCLEGVIGKMSWNKFENGESYWQNRREDNRREKHEKTFKHKDFTKYARKTTKSHLITSSRGTGKVGMVAKGDHRDFLGVPIDGMRK